MRRVIGMDVHRTFEANHSKATAALAAAREARDGVARRLADLSGRRQAIILRRSEGREEEGDREELALLAADHEGLELLLGRHTGTVAEAEGPVHAAANAAAVAKHELQRAELRATEAALLARISEIEKAMVEAGRGLRATRDALGGGLLAWVPSDELMSIITPSRNRRYW
jgi:hypothetical protein